MKAEQVVKKAISRNTSMTHCNQLVADQNQAWEKLLNRLRAQPSLQSLCQQLSKPSYCLKVADDVRLSVDNEQQNQTLHCKKVHSRVSAVDKGNILVL